MPISVPSSCTPRKQLQFLHTVVGDFLDERIDGKQTQDFFCKEKWSTLALKATFRKRKDNTSSIIFKSRISALCFDFWLFLQKSLKYQGILLFPALQLSKIAFEKEYNFNHGIADFLPYFFFATKTKSSNWKCLASRHNSTLFNQLENIKEKQPQLGYSCAFTLVCAITCAMANERSTAVSYCTDYCLSA